MAKNVYEIVTERILEKLEQGTVPWDKPWAGGGCPQNLVSGKEYRGVNVWLRGNRLVNRRHALLRRRLGQNLITRKSN